MINQKQLIVQEIIYSIEVLKSILCDQNDDCILVQSNITIIGHKVAEAASKNCAPLIDCITKIDGTSIDDFEDFDLVMLMYNMLEYSSHYSDTTEILRFYC